MSTEPTGRDPRRPAPVQALTSTVSGYAAGLTLTAATGLVAAAVMAFLPTPLPSKVTAVGAIVLAGLVFGVLPARLSVGISRDGVRYRRGTGQARWIPAEEIEVAEAVRVGYGAIVGRGIRPAWTTDRRIVRAGWALHLVLRSREQVWLSTRGPLDASAVLAPAGPAHHDSKREDQTP